jgi:glutathione S-transferase
VTLARISAKSESDRKTEIKGPQVPFFVRPISKAIASKVEAGYLAKEYENQFTFIEDQLATSPQSGKFFAGAKISGADFIMIFPLELADRAGVDMKKYPKTAEWVESMHGRDSYKRAVEKIEKATGEKYDAKI